MLGSLALPRACLGSGWEIKLAPLVAGHGAEDTPASPGVALVSVSSLLESHTDGLVASSFLGLIFGCYCVLESVKPGSQNCRPFELLEVEIFLNMTHLGRAYEGVD